MKNDKVYDSWHGTTVVSVRKNKEVVIATTVKLLWVTQ